jgi:hypothetical protein
MPTVTSPRPPGAADLGYGDAFTADTRRHGQRLGGQRLGRQRLGGQRLGCRWARRALRLLADGLPERRVDGFGPDELRPPAAEPLPLRVRDPFDAPLPERFLLDWRSSALAA